MHLAEILGHQRPLAIIDAYIEKSCFRGGFIFSGPEGIGKKTAAKIIAQKLNNSEKLEHPDLHIIENGQAQIKIDDIRSLIREASFRPYAGQMKIFIIDNAHKLNSEAANSLLKILEEPPLDTLIILITDKPQNIIQTVLSRCKVIKFSPLDFDEEMTLKEILEKHGDGRPVLVNALTIKELDIIEKRLKYNGVALEDIPRLDARHSEGEGRKIDQQHERSLRS